MSENNQSLHLKYLTGLVNQPLEQWEGFYLTRADGMNFGLRFQLAFPVYALYALAQVQPHRTEECTAVIERYIQKMLQPRVWAYWLQGALATQHKSQPEGVRPTLVQGVVETAHNRLGLSGGLLPLDPCQQGNIQYSGHLASMLGFYQLLSGDDRYNREGFRLIAEVEGEKVSFEYSYTQLVERIHQQMRENHFGGVCCEPSRAYAACNNHACISNILHDRLYGTNFAEANAGWANWVERKMLTSAGAIPLPAPNGLLSVAYMPALKMAIPVSFNFTDAWGFAFMAAWHPVTVQQVYPRFRKRLKSSADGLKLNSVGINESMEISTEALNTAFALVLATEMGDTATAQGLHNYLDAHYNPLTENGLYYADARPAPYVTALVALADALPSSGSLNKLVNGF